MADAFRLLAQAMAEEEDGDWPSIGGPGSEVAGAPIPAR